LREEKAVAFTKINKRFRRKIAIPKIEILRNIFPHNQITHQPPNCNIWASFCNQQPVMLPWKKNNEK
jgi:hypothetical protein